MLPTFYVLEQKMLPRNCLSSEIDMLIGRFRPTERLAPCYPTYRITAPRSRYTSPRGILPSCCMCLLHPPLRAAVLCPADRQQAAGPEEEAEGDVRR